MRQKKVKSSKKVLEPLLVTAGAIAISAQAEKFDSTQPLAHTYSIVARDSLTGEMGVAVQSHWFTVGSVVAWGEAGVGVIATQSLANVSFGARGLELLKAGLTPQKALDSLLATDEGSEFRQVAILDAEGKVVVHTGKNCIPFAGHITGNNFAVQANLMANEKVWPAMAETFQKTQGSLAERMVAALEAAQQEGGDIRGQQSASVLIVKGTASGKVWEDRLIDLRVEDHPRPVEELKRLLKIFRAYEHMNKGDMAIEKNDLETALKEYTLAKEMFPENEEMVFWQAVTLANQDRLEEALPLFREVFKKNKNWLTLTPRLTEVGILEIDQTELKKILSVGK
jgi:uncharacterized Ntn-hydrolase superfamily protein